jgi:hypothetical protein
MVGLKVRVNEELTLDAGWCEEMRWDDGTIRRQIHPPQTTMFEQLLDYSPTGAVGLNAFCLSTWRPAYS